jgi:hypothetical protein
MRGESWRGRRLGNRREFCELGEHLSLGCARRKEKGWFSRCFRKIFFSDEARSIGRVKCARAIHGKYMVFGPNIWPAFGPFGAVGGWQYVEDGAELPSESVDLYEHDVVKNVAKWGAMLGCQEEIAKR